jgi:cytochrome P450
MGAPSYPHDLYTDEVLAHPYAHYAALRELGPVVWLDAHEMHAVTRWTEARAALFDAATFCSGRGVAMNEPMNAIGAGRSLIMTDGELHEHLRRILGRNITPRALSSLNERTDELAAALVSRLVARGTFDAAADLAQSLPTTIVPDLVGWPDEGRPHLLEWAGATFNCLGPMNDRAKQSVPPVQAMLGFAEQVAASGSMAPGSVGAGVLEAAARGDIEPERVAPLLVGYLAPSLDTTISGIASAVWLLAQDPDQWEALRADRSLVPNAFNEALRVESPIRSFTRVTTSATRLGEVELPEGARTVILYASANRDETHFEDPDRFDVTRANASDHLGFGFGSHSCAGQGLARMEAHAVLNALLDQVESLELAGQASRSINNLINGWGSVPVRVTPA